MNHVHEKIEKTSGSGFSDYKRVTEKLGNRSLTALLNTMDSEPTDDGRNSHHAIHDKLRLLDLPAQSCCFVAIGDFLDDPEQYFSQIPDGDYYFASIKPGTHLAHAESARQVVDFARRYIDQAGSDERSREMYISHNGEAAMSGHIIIADDGQPNSIHAEFTIDNFNAFHRGFHTPEISLNRKLRSSRFSFRDSLAADNWRTNERFTCFGGVTLTRPEMANYIHQSIRYIPHDGDYFLPGYYEVLFEKTSERSARPVFIEAVVKGLD